MFIYDRDGVELHKLKSHIEPTRLEFLPYHWLLVSVVSILTIPSRTALTAVPGKCGVPEVPRYFNRTTRS